MEKCKLCQCSGQCPSQKMNMDFYCRRINPDDPLYDERYIKLVVACGDKNKTIEKAGFVDKAVNLTKAVTKWAKSGFTYAPADEIKNRLNICSDCEHNKDGNCEVCGCDLEEKTKWATEKCPINKWLEVDINSKKGGCGCGQT